MSKILRRASSELRPSHFQKSFIVRLGVLHPKVRGAEILNVAVYGLGIRDAGDPGEQPSTLGLGGPRTLHRGTPSFA